MKEMKVRLTFMEQVLGTASGDPELHTTYIASKAPDFKTMEEEIAEHGVDEVVEKGMTIFPKDSNGNPFLYDYQIKGFFKNSCKAMREADDSESAALKAYKQKIDNLVFVEERKIFFRNPDGGNVEIGNCQRPLRASTPQGERVALANSESVPAGTQVEFTVKVLKDGLMKIVEEWLDYGKLNGIGQWHNSGCGRFTWEKVTG